jgi:hypothetical protein
MAAVDMNYGAVQDLHEFFSKQVPTNQLVAWWIEQCGLLAAAGKPGEAALGLDFIRKAGGMDPWGEMTSENYDRIMQLEAVIGI